MTLEKRKHISRYIYLKKPFLVKFYTSSEDVLQAVNSIFHKVFSRVGQYYIAHTVVQIMREVIMNALKANAKRDYFGKNGLDISNPEDYEKGMQHFKKLVFSNDLLFNEHLRTHNQYVLVGIEFFDNGVYLTVSNNVPMTQTEVDRVNARINYARKYDSIMEAFEDIHDSAEGAGLGIALAVITLQRIGIQPEMFSYTVHGRNTTAHLFIPSRIRPIALTRSIRQHLYEEVDPPPVLSHDYTEQSIQNCSDEAELKALLLSEPSFVTAVFHRAARMQFSQLLSLSEAVYRIGIQSVRKLLIETVRQNRQYTRHNDFTDLVNHGRRTAEIVAYITDFFQLKLHRENAVTAGLMHDFGKFILFAAGNDFTLQVAHKLQDQRLATLSFLEEISIDTSHSEIGAHIASRMQFPSEICNAIALHHYPDITTDIHSDPQKVVYLANMFAMYEMKLATYYDFDETILSEIGLAQQNTFMQFYTKLQNNTGAIT